LAYREVTMIEVREVLRRWLAGAAKKEIAAYLGIDPKTVRRYAAVATACGLVAGGGEGTLTEEVFIAVLAALQPARARAPGEAWQRCDASRERIASWLSQRVRLSKIHRLLKREGVEVPYSTLHRFAVGVLDFGRTTPTVPVADPAPGKEVQLDTGWMEHVLPDALGRRRRMRAWIFTPPLSRYRFVWPCFRETTQTGIEACEAAWAFYGGIFETIIVDNTKAIVQEADSVAPRLNATFLEYAQARGFAIDTARVRRPRDKARVERTVRDVRDDCFGGEILRTLADAELRARVWSSVEYGMRRHSTTQRMPREHFEADEKPALRAPPTELYDIPIWCEPKVAPDQHAQVAKALYSLPREYRGRVLRARADRCQVRFYDGVRLIKVHTRQPAHSRATDPNDFPKDAFACGQRDARYLLGQAHTRGPNVGRFAQALLDVPLPWTRMRRVYKLFSLAKRYGDERLDEACAKALAADLIDVTRLARMLEVAASSTASCPCVVPALPRPARFLRDKTHFAMTPPPPKGERH